MGEQQNLAWRGRLQQASQTPGYELQIETENALGTGQFSGVDTLETTVALSSVWEWGDQRQTRINAVNAQGKVIELQQQIQRLELTAEVARRYVNVQYAEARVQHLQSRQKVLRRVLRTVKRRVNAGLSPTAERLRAETDVAEAAIQLDIARQTLQIAKQQLVLLWNGDTTTIQVSGDVVNIDSLAPDKVLLDRLLESPYLQQVVAESRQLNAETLAVRAANQPDIRWSLGSRYHHESDDIALVSSVEIPLFSASRNQGAIATAGAEGAIAKLSIRQRQLALKQQLRAVQSDWQHATALVNHYQQNFIPKLKQVQAQARRLYDEGKYSYLELSQAHQALLNAQLTILDAAKAAQLARIHIDRLAPISGAVAVNPATQATEEN